MGGASPSERSARHSWSGTLAATQAKERHALLPPICGCGHQTPITDVRYVLRCCSNCPLYRDGAAWERLLAGVLQGAGLLGT